MENLPMNEKKAGPKLTDLSKNKIVRDETSELHARNHETMQRWREAKENKMLVLSDREEIRHGLTADWGMFDFLLGAYGPKFPASRSFAENLMFFWSVFWPHLKTNVESYERISRDFESSVEEERMTMVAYADQNLELKLMRSYCENHLTHRQKTQLATYIKSQKQQVQSKVAQLQKKEMENEKGTKEETPHGSDGPSKEDAGPRPDNHTSAS